MAIQYTQSDLSGGMRGEKGQFLRPDNKSFKASKNFLPDDSGGLNQRAGLKSIEGLLLPSDKVEFFKMHGRVYAFVYDPLFNIVHKRIADDQAALRVDMDTHDGVTYQHDIPQRFTGDYQEKISKLARWRYWTVLAGRGGSVASIDQPEAERYGYGKLASWSGQSPTTLGFYAFNPARFASYMNDLDPIAYTIDTSRSSFWWHRFFIMDITIRENPVIVSHQVARNVLVKSETASAGFSDWESDVSERTPENRAEHYGESSKSYQAVVGSDRVWFYDPTGELPTLTWGNTLEDTVKSRVNIMSELSTSYSQRHFDDIPYFVFEASHVTNPPLGQSTDFLIGLPVESPFTPLAGVDSESSLIQVPGGSSIGEPVYFDSPKMDTPAAGDSLSDIVKRGFAPYPRAVEQDGRLYMYRREASAPGFTPHASTSFGAHVYEVSFSAYLTFGATQSDELNVGPGNTNLEQVQTKRPIVPPRWRITTEVDNGGVITRPTYEYYSNASVSRAGASRTGLFDIQVSEYLDHLSYFYLDLIQRSGIRDGRGNLLDMATPDGYTSDGAFSESRAAQYASRLCYSLDLLFLTKRGAASSSRVIDRPLRPLTTGHMNIRALIGYQTWDFFRAMGFYVGRLILGGTLSAQNVMAVSRNLSPVTFSFTARSRPDGELTDESAYSQALTPAGGAPVILWMNRLGGRFYIGTDSGLITITPQGTEVANFDTIQYDEDVKVSSAPISVLNALYFIDLPRKNLYLLERSNELQRRTALSVSRNLYHDYVMGNNIVSVKSSDGDSWMLMAIDSIPRSLFFGMVTGGYDVKWHEIEFADEVKGYGVIGDDIYLKIGEKISTLTPRVFDVDIEGFVETSFTPYSPLVVAFIKDDEPKTNVDHRDLTRGSLIGSFDGDVLAVSESTGSSDNLGQGTALDFNDKLRDDVSESVKFVFKGKKNKIVAYKYGVSD